MVGLDESPQQLISEVRESFTDAKGVIHQDYEYKREGVADLYMVCEPLLGKREIFVKENHNRLNWAEVVRFTAEGDVSCGAEDNDCGGQFIGAQTGRVV